MRRLVVDVPPPLGVKRDRSATAALRATAALPTVTIDRHGVATDDRLSRSCGGRTARP